MLMRVSFVSLIVLLCAPRQGSASGAVMLPGTACDLTANFGVTDTQAIDAFVKQVYAAANAPSADAFAPLVEFPLRVSRNQRQVKIGDAKQLSADSRIFTPQVRKAIVDARGLFCRPDMGISFGNGTFWVKVDTSQARPRFAIYVVNVPAVEATDLPSLSHPETRLQCTTKKLLVTVEDVGGGTFRYRARSREQTNGAPELELLGKIVSGGGSGVCAQSDYAFANHVTSYLVSETPCGPGNIPPDTIAQLTVSSGGKTLGQWWCEKSPQNGE